MHVREPIIDAYTRIKDLAVGAVEGLDAEALAHRPGPDANPIGWLVWHLTRVQDHHISELAGVDQAWTSGGWAQRFGMPPDPSDIGYGHTSEQVAAVPAHDPDLLAQYHEAVLERTLAFLNGVESDDLDRIVDRRWEPPVTMGARLVSVIGDDYQHVGQAHYLRGLLGR
jgi:uncharacterized damage-inducible protein DinB